MSSETLFCGAWPPHVPSVALCIVAALIVLTILRPVKVATATAVA